jgi:hypothetical protein
VGSPADAPDYPLPPVRRLRVYAFDPQASVELDTAIINDTVIKLPWETRWEDPLEKGPVNDYLEVIDYDPSSGVFYAPVDLGDPILLAQDGLTPSEGRPQFHQQMVFAVAMDTIRTFERALGRPVLWAGDKQAPKDSLERAFTKRLRIYPHALREANAYYSPQKRALLFGYFKAPKSGGIDGSWVFTCLSRDIVAHETTHAIFHGMQQRSIEPSNVDALAFHEAFADIVALLQHFSMADVVRHELARSKGSLREHGLLTGLARQFGQATGRKGSLRYALDLLALDTAGRTDREAAPDLANTLEPHARGGFLVAAVFDAFVTIYERRAADLFRLGRSTARAGSTDLPAELVGRLTREAAKAAEHVLRMCVRALDYIAPVDLHFGEYLRAVITADTDLVPDDQMRYRVAFVEAFKKRGIVVPGCISMAPDSLLWDPPDLTDLPELRVKGGSPDDAVSAMFAELLGHLQISVGFDGSLAKPNKGQVGRIGFEPGDFERNLRRLSMQVVQFNQARIHDWLDQAGDDDEAWEKLLGLRMLAADDARRTAPVPALGSLASRDGKSTPLFEVGSARISRRAGPDGQELHQLIVQVTQRRRGYFDPTEQEAAERGDVAAIGDERWKEPDFWFRGGATIHVDLRDGRLRRIIRKRIDNDERLKSERAFRTGDSTGLAISPRGVGRQEPFAFMHRSGQ